MLEDTGFVDVQIGDAVDTFGGATGEEKALGGVRTSSIASQRLVPSGTKYAIFSSFSTAETELPTFLTAAFN